MIASPGAVLVQSRRPTCVTKATMAKRPAPPRSAPEHPSAPEDAAADYVLEDQIGHLLRRAHQRASAIFAAAMAEHNLTPTQFAALVKIADEGVVSQNRLGRLTAMDPATMQGVVQRLAARHLVQRAADGTDRRRTALRLSAAGEALVARAIPVGMAITRDTLAPLSAREQARFLELLRKIS